MDYRPPAGGVQIEWDSYAEFWSVLPNITSEVKEIIEEALPILEDLVELGAEKHFWESLKEAGVPTLVAKRIAMFIHRTVYKKK